MTPSTLKKLENVIISQGFSEPIAVWPNEGRNWILNGHQRHTALQSLRSKGWFVPPVPVALVEAADEDEARKKVLTLASQFGDFNQDHLLEFVAKARLDTDWIRNNARLAAGDFKWPVLVTPTDDDEIPPVAETPIVKRGEIYILGDHRLMCGDSTDCDDFNSLMNGDRAKICFTSPPYNAGSMNIVGQPGTNEKYNAFDDNQTDDQYFDFLKKNMSLILENSDECLYNIGLVQNNKRVIIRLLAEFEQQFKDIIYWRKKTVAPHIQPGIVNNAVEFILCFGDGKRKFQHAQFNQGTYFNVIEGNHAGENQFSKIHKATFPLYLPENIITNFCPPGGVVLEPFGGTGTTMIAAEKLGRRCFAMELDPLYCGVILDRWQEFSGKIAHRDDGETWDSIKATRNG